MNFSINQDTLAAPQPVAPRPDVVPVPLGGIVALDDPGRVLVVESGSFGHVDKGARTLRGQLVAQEKIGGAILGVMVRRGITILAPVAEKRVRT